MRVHRNGLIVVAIIGLVALVGGPLGAVSLVGWAVAVFLLVGAAEIAVNMIRHRDMRIRSRLLGSLFTPLRFGPYSR